MSASGMHDVEYAKESLTNAAVQAMDQRYVMHTYARWPIALVKGEGMWVEDADGKRYLDLTSGIAVSGLGHAHPAVTEAICQQAGQLMHCSNLYNIPQQARLAQLLVENSCFDKAFFCNSGAEANEAAIKMARRYSKKKYGEHKHAIITFEHSFHGRTLATVTATAQPKYQEGFGPLIPGFSYAKPDDIASVRALVTDDTCAIMLEPVQGEGGVIPMDAAFVQQVRQLCDEQGLLLIFDEIQCGNARTGTLFAYEQFGIEPDILTLAKGLANGVPIGATLAKEEVADVFQPGTHGTTFGGNPLATAAGVATLTTLIEGGYAERAKRVGDYLAMRLQELVEELPMAVGVRGMGLMRGLVLNRPAGDVVRECIERGVLVLSAGGTTVRFLPALIVEEAHIDHAVNAVRASLISLAG